MGVATDERRGRRSMRVLITGSAGHLGEALMRHLPRLGHAPVGLDIIETPFTDFVGSVGDRALVRRAMAGVDAILHTATLHKPHVATHSKQDFVATNITGTLALLEAAAALGITRFIFTSTTSAFGAALSPPTGAPAAWIDETVASVPKNIYGVTKAAAEDLCALFAREQGMNCTVLRTSRFFPEPDDHKATRSAFADANVKANEFLFRRVDLEDVVLAHECAIRVAPASGFARFIISATSPFRKRQLKAIRQDPAAAAAAIYPRFSQVYGAANYRMFADIERVYVNDRARAELGWAPIYDFGRVLEQIAKGAPIGSALTRAVGIKGYHSVVYEDGVYPTE